MRLTIWPAIAVSILSGCAGRAEPELHVRGEVNRREWTLTECDRSKVYRLIFSSYQADHFYKELDRLAVTPGNFDSPVTVELTGSIIPPFLFADDPPVLGVSEVLSL